MPGSHSSISFPYPISALKEQSIYLHILMKSVDFAPSMLYRRAYLQSISGGSRFAPRIASIFFSLIKQLGRRPRRDDRCLIVYEYYFSVDLPRFDLSTLLNTRIDGVPGIIGPGLSP